MFGMFFHSFDFDEVNDFLEEVAEKVNQWVVAHQR